MRRRPGAGSTGATEDSGRHRTGGDEGPTVLASVSLRTSGKRGTFVPGLPAWHAGSAPGADVLKPILTIAVPAIDIVLAEQLAALARQGLRRELRRVASPQGPHVRMDGRELRNFSSNDYLGLANHPALIEATVRAARDYGAGCGASRLICGNLTPHHEAEEALAAFKGTAAALIFSSGYTAAIGVIPALVGPEDVVIVDKLVHASCIDAARLSGAKLRVFAHNEMGDLEEILKWATGRSELGRILIVTESVFSMDGDFSPLKLLVDLKEKYGAWLMLDEAHATGCFGPNRRGLAEAAGVSHQIDIQMGTLGKALGAAGGFVAGSRTLIDYLVNRARSFIFSTAPVPAAAAAARAGIELVQSAEGATRAATLWQRVGELKTELAASGWSPNPSNSAIVPLMVGGEDEAQELSRRLRGLGFLVPAIRYSTVARGLARLRVTVSAAHTSDDIQAFGEAISVFRPEPNTPGTSLAA